MCIYKVGYYFQCPGKPRHQTVTLRSRETVGCGNKFFEGVRSYKEKALIDRLARRADVEADEEQTASDPSSVDPPNTRAIQRWISTRSTATLRHKIRKFDYETQVLELAKAVINPCGCTDRKAWDYFNKLRKKYCEKCSGKLELYDLEPPVIEDFPWHFERPSKFPDSRALAAIQEPQFVRTGTNEYYCGGDQEVARRLKFATDSPPPGSRSRSASPERMRRRSVKRPSFDACSDEGHGDGPSHRFTARQDQPNRPSFESCSDSGHEGAPARTRHSSRPLIQDILSSNAERSSRRRHSAVPARSELFELHGYCSLLSNDYLSTRPRVSCSLRNRRLVNY